VIGSSDRGNPVHLLDELKVLGLVELADERQRDQEAREGSDVGPELDGALIRRRDQEHYQQAHERCEKNERKHVIHV
jgi:hypothetical protein